MLWTWEERLLISIPASSFQCDPGKLIFVLSRVGMNKYRRPSDLCQSFTTKGRKPCRLDSSRNLHLAEVPILKMGIIGCGKMDSSPHLANCYSKQSKDSKSLPNVQIWVISLSWTLYLDIKKWHGIVYSWVVWNDNFVESVFWFPKSMNKKS